MDHTSGSQTGSGVRMKFIVGIFVIAAALVYLIVSSTQANAQYFLTIDELYAKRDAMMDRELRISGAVIGDSIVYDRASLTLTFVIANIPGDNDEIESQGGLAAVLHQAVVDPSRQRLLVRYNGPIPDLLRDEAQAIITGKLGEDEVFIADELLLKCPTKYEEALPEQTQ